MVLFNFEIIQFWLGGKDTVKVKSRMSGGRLDIMAGFSLQMKRFSLKYEIFLVISTQTAIGDQRCK